MSSFDKYGKTTHGEPQTVFEKTMGNFEKYTTIVHTFVLHAASMDFDGDRVAPLLLSLLPYVNESLVSGRAGEEGWPANDEWTAWLLSLDEAHTHVCERNGLHRAASCIGSMPSDLRELCDVVAAASNALGRQGGGADGECSCSCSWRQSAEKAQQVKSLLAAVGARCHGGLGHIRRVVDVGCGKGHLTAALASALDVPALGLDFDAELLVAARALYPSVHFEARDIVDDGLPCMDGDLVVGLHPCGCLGEAVVSAIACRPCSVTLLMVPCCWHKQRAPYREALSAAGASSGRLRLPHAALKKASMALDASRSEPSRR